LSNSEILKAITAAAAAGVSGKDIPARIGLTATAWQKFLESHRQEVTLAIAAGRSEAQVRVNARLEVCSSHGNLAATLYILQHWHGWKIKPPEVWRRRR
jgi:hypothetical protein